MPDFYAHYRFGKTVLPTLPADVQQCITRFRRLFDAGLQGPDFFFYVNPLMKNPLGELGSQFHNQTGREFFTYAAAQAKTEAARAYLYGVLGHFCLDSACHPFVNRKTQEGVCTHPALESEFDRYLMAAEGIAEPHFHDATVHMKVTRGECVTMADFYPPATPAQVNRGVRHMRWFLRFLVSRKRERHQKLVRLLDKSLLDAFIPASPVPEFQRLDSELLARFNRAARDYPGMLQELMGHMRDEKEFGELFDVTFS